MRMLRKNYQQIIKIVETNKHEIKISELEKKTFSFSFHTYQFLREMVVERLVKLIRIFIDYRLSEKKELRLFRNIDLITCQVSDLIRGRIMLNEKQLLKFFSILNKLHIQKKQIRIIKIKNRMNEPMNDATLIIKLIDE